MQDKSWITASQKGPPQTDSSSFSEQKLSVENPTEVHQSRSQEPLVTTPSDSTTWSQVSDGTSSLETAIANGPYVIEDIKQMKPVQDSNGGPAIPEDPNDTSDKCGWGSFRPAILQRFRTPQWVLFWLCWAGALQGLAVNGFVNVVISTIEKRYELKSTESGLIAGGYDIASFLCLVPVSYFGGSRSKPLFIGSGVLVLALGSFVFSLPHIISGPYSFSKETENVCLLNQNWTAPTCEEDTVDSRSSLSNYKYLFLLGQLLHGAGAAPLYTLGVHYIDESVSTKMSSVYVGIYYTMAIIGPALGYMLGGQFLKIYTDMSVDASNLGLTPSSSVWVGAWWIGFVLSALVGLLIAIPLTAFPRVLPGYKEIQAKKIPEMHKKLEESAAVQVGFGTTLKDLPTSFRILVTNPTFMFLNLAGASEGMLVSGLATFLPKLIESQFSLAASWAAVLMGFVSVPGAGGGTFLGGYLVKKFNLRCAGIIKMCIICSLVSLALVFVFVIHCPNVRLAGSNVAYTNSSVSLMKGKTNLDGECSATCQCSRHLYDPVCGVDNIMYYSPCYAGCQIAYHSEGTKVYVNCSCISGSPRNVTLDNGNSISIEARREKCVSECTLMPFFLVAIFFSMLFTFLVSMPSLTATLRCVADSQKSFALGVQWIAVRLLGTIPAPILFGSLIDLSCELWSDSCSSQGACLLYDNKRMSTNIVILAVILKALSCIFFFMAWFLYKPPSHLEDGSNKDDSLKKENIFAFIRTLFCGFLPCCSKSIDISEVSHVAVQENSNKLSQNHALSVKT